jgi:hypothetical protein
MANFDPAEIAEGLARRPEGESQIAEIVERTRIERIARINNIKNYRIRD